MIAAVVVVAALSLLTVTVMGGLAPDDDDDLALVDTEGYDRSTSTTSTTVRSTTTTTRPRRSTSTVAPRPTTTEAPQVLGAVTQRDPGPGSSAGGPAPSTSTTEAPRPVTASPRPAPAPSSPAPATTAPTTTTTTTTLVCRNSTDPACGPLVWDPDPGPYDVKVYAVRVPTSAYVGERVVFAVNRVEPAGADALGACTTWQVSDPGVVNTSSCEELNRSCGRHGPHTPPTASRDELTLSHGVTFATPGEHTVRVSGTTATHLADGCASPYLESFSRTYTVIVRER